jgi:hypothetical protein
MRSFSEHLNCSRRVFDKTMLILSVVSYPNYFGALEKLMGTPPTEFITTSGNF